MGSGVSKPLRPLIHFYLQRVPLVSVAPEGFHGLLAACNKKWSETASP
jgi:hypothetical protein